MEFIKNTVLNWLAPQESPTKKPRTENLWRCLSMTLDDKHLRVSSYIANGVVIFGQPDTMQRITNLIERIKTSEYEYALLDALPLALYFEFVLAELDRLRISYYVWHADFVDIGIPKSLGGLFASTVGEVVCHGVMIRFEKIAGSIYVSLIIHEGLSISFNTDIQCGFGFRIVKLDEDTVELVDAKQFRNEKKYDKHNVFRLCLDKIFPEFRFIKLIMSPPGAMWHNFLFTHQLYDPRLLCLVWLFAKK